MRKLGEPSPLFDKAKYDAERLAYESKFPTQAWTEPTGDYIEAACKEYGFDLRSGFWSILVNTRDSMTTDQWLAALKRLRALIADGLPLVADDSNDIGNKYTECSWGMCGARQDVFTDPATHIWPIQFLRQSRVAPIGRPKGCLCPIDRRNTIEDDRYQGCFYSCRIFSPKKGEKRPGRELVLSWFDKAIAEVESREAQA